MRNETHAVTGETTQYPDAPLPVLSQGEMDRIAQVIADLSAKQTAKADALITFLIEKTPAEVSARVLSDITDLASAKQVIAKLAVAVSVITKSSLR